MQLQGHNQNVAVLVRHDDGFGKSWNYLLHATHFPPRRELTEDI